MISISSFLEIAAQQAQLQLGIVEAAMQSCIDASRAMASKLDPTEVEESGSEPTALPIEVPFGTIQFQTEDCLVFAVVHAEVMISDQAFEPAAETHLRMDFRHCIDPFADSAASIVERSRMMVVQRLRSAADVLETAPR